MIRLICRVFFYLRRPYVPARLWPPLYRFQRRVRVLPFDAQVIWKFLQVAIRTRHFRFGRDVRAIGRHLRRSYLGVY